VEHVERVEQGAERQKSERGSEAEVRIAASPVRCPFCHDDVNPTGADWVACQACLARHHSSCWKESEKCAACQRSAVMGPGALAIETWTDVSERYTAKAVDWLMVRGLHKWAVVAFGGIPVLAVLASFVVGPLLFADLPDGTWAKIFCLVQMPAVFTAMAISLVRLRTEQLLKIHKRVKSGMPRRARRGLEAFFGISPRQSSICILFTLLALIPFVGLLALPVIFFRYRFGLVDGVDPEPPSPPPPPGKPASE
jgi:hypothetical protein